MLRSGKPAPLIGLPYLAGEFDGVPRFDAAYYVYDRPVQDGERTVTLRRNGDVHVIGLAYHTVAGTSEDFPAIEAAIDVLARERAEDVLRHRHVRGRVDAVAGDVAEHREVGDVTTLADSSVMSLIQKGMSSSSDD